MNCQRQGETCDYSIRLNWEGRSKKKHGTPSPGQVNFSAGMISARPSRPGTGDSATTPTSGQMQFHAATFGILPQAPKEGSFPIPQSENTFASEPPSQYAPELQAASVTRARPSDMSMIDPALTGSIGSPVPMYIDGIYGGIHSRPEHQYTQSYERYRSLTPTTPISAQPPAVSRLRAQGIEDSISPGDSGMRSPSASTFSNRSAVVQNADSPVSTPPFYGNGKDDGASPEFGGFDRPMKRVRYHPAQDVNSPSYDPTMPPPNLTSYNSFVTDPQAANTGIVRPSSSVGTPLTPASSHSDDGYKTYPSKVSPHGVQESPDLRRLSVSSLLSGPPGMPYPNERTYSNKSNSEVQDWSLELRDVYQDTTTWGIDRGFKDLDIGKNDDMNAISGSSPVAMRDHLDLVLDEDGEFTPIEFGFGMETNNTAFENGGYYDKPVAICIPRALEPLPSKLLENPMNLLVICTLADGLDFR